MSEKVKFEVDVDKQMGIARFELPNDAAQRLRTRRYRVTMKPVGEEAEEEPELKPCPFCGYKGTEILSEVLWWGGGMSYWVRCGDCYSAGATEGTRDDAIASWNRRTP